MCYCRVLGTTLRHKKSLSLGRIFTSVLMEKRSPFTAFSTGLRSTLISLSVSITAPVVGPVITTLSPTTGTSSRSTGPRVCTP